MAEEIPSWDDTEEAVPSWDDTEEPTWEGTEEAPSGPAVASSESAAKGFFDTASFGFDDEIAGGLEAVGRAVGVRGLGAPNFSDAELSSPEGLSNFHENYEQARDARRLAKSEAENANPGSYIGGQVAGGFAIPGAGPTSLAGKVAQGAAQAATYGAGSANEIEDIGVDAGIGAGIGTVAGIGSATIGKGARLLGKTVESQGRKLIGGTPSQAADLAEGAGRRIFDEGMVRPFPFGLSGDDAHKVLPKVEKKIADARLANQALVERAGSGGANIPVNSVIQKIESEAAKIRSEGLFDKADAMDAMAKKLRANAEQIKTDSFAPKVMENIKREAQQVFDTSSGTAATQGRKAVASIERKALEDSLGEFNPVVGNQYIQNNKIQSSMIPTKEALENTVGKESRKSVSRFLDPTRIGVEAFKSVASPANVGWSAHKIEQFLTLSPQMFGKFAPLLQEASGRGSQALAATHYVLQSTQPEYQETLKAIEEQDQVP